MVFDTAVVRDRDRPRWRTALTVSLSMHVAIIVLALAGSVRRRAEPAPSPVVVTVLPEDRVPLPPTPVSAGELAAAATATRPRHLVKPAVRLRSDPAENQLAPLAAASLSAPPLADSPQEPSQATGPRTPSLQGDLVAQADSAPAGGGSGPAAGAAPAAQASQAGTAPRILAPAQGDGQLAVDPNEARYQPVIPPLLRRPGAKFTPLVKLCVRKDGSVGEVTVMRPSDPAVDPAIVEKIRLFKFRPYLDHGHPIPFCFFREYRLSVEE